MNDVPRERRSARGFRREPLPAHLLDDVLVAAQAAPSWCNTQPWRVWITAPPVTAALGAALVAAAEAGPPRPELAFPDRYPEPYLAHRRACAGALYAAMGVARDDAAARRDAWLRNYDFFGAPHAAIVACDRRLVPYALIDVGVWLGWLLAAADARGLATCPLASVAGYPDTLRAHVTIPDELAILFAVAIGWSDPDVAANGCRTARDPVARNVTFVAPP